MSGAAREGLPKYRILACATQGDGSGDEARLRELISSFNYKLAVFRKSAKLDGFWQLLRSLRTTTSDLFVLEGTGVSAGAAAILARVLWNRHYVVSSGDAVSPYLSARIKWAAPIFSLYEWLLCSASSGFIGWTPYLVGRALTMGAKRGITIPGWAAPHHEGSSSDSSRRAVREGLGIPQDAVVFGIAGSLNWSARYEYCYGMELVRAARKSVGRAYVLIVGDGSGLEHLRKEAGPSDGRTVFFTGRVEKAQVAGYLSAMDVGSLPQSVDGVGNFRYSTKLPEYKAAGLLIVTNQIPASYDLDRGDFLRLPGASPWSRLFVSRLAELMSTLNAEEVARLRNSLVQDDTFDRDLQVARATAFLQDVIRNQVEGGRENG